MADRPTQTAEWAAGKTINGVKPAAEVAGDAWTAVRRPDCAAATPGRVAAGGPGTGRACPEGRLPRDGGAPRRPRRTRSARRRVAEWRRSPTARRAAPNLPGTRQDVGPA